MKTIDLSTTANRKNQQVVYHFDKLTSGNHRITIVNRGGGPVAIDALVVMNTH